MGLNFRWSVSWRCFSQTLTLFLLRGKSLGSDHLNIPSDPQRVAGRLSLEQVIKDTELPRLALTPALSAFSPQGVWLPCPLYRRLQHEPLGEAETAGPVVERARHPPPLRSAEGIFCLCVRDVRANRGSETRFKQTNKKHKTQQNTKNMRMERSISTQKRKRNLKQKKKPHRGRNTGRLCLVKRVGHHLLIFQC